MKYGTVSRNVAVSVDPPRADKRTQRFLTIEQAKAFLEAAKHDRLFALFATVHPSTYASAGGSAFPGLTWTLAAGGLISIKRFSELIRSSTQQTGECNWWTRRVGTPIAC